MCNDNEVNYADRYFDTAKKILEEYITGDAEFLSDIATKYLNIDQGLKGINWNNSVYNRISGSKGHLSGLELTKYRGEYLNTEEEYLYQAIRDQVSSKGPSALNKPFKIFRCLQISSPDIH